MTRRNFAIYALALIGTSTSSFAAVFQSNTSVRAEQFANEDQPGSRLDLNLSLVSSPDEGAPADEKASSLPARELHFYSFFESGTGGDRSIDLDRTVLRVSMFDQSHLWIGRTHPLLEATHGDTPTYLDAIGTNWAQNQSDALSPRVTGWVGVGGHLEDSKRSFSITTAFSPIFLPSFGPRLQLSEDSAAQGSRFSRLPPQYVEQGNALLPLRYKLDVGSIKSIIFQPQAFISAGYSNSDMRADVMDWTAPNPSPEVDTDFALVTHTSGLVSDDSADVMVDAHPKFHRQHFTGVRYSAFGIFGKPLLAGTYEWFRKEVTASIQFTLIDFVTLGYLNRWTPNASNASSATTLSPSFANQLVWTEISTRFYHDLVTPSLHIEEHLASNNRGRMFRPKITYSVTSNLSIFALAEVIRGQDRSYFGEWRSLGSAAMGVNWLW